LPFVALFGSGLALPQVAFLASLRSMLGWAALHRAWPGVKPNDV